MSKFITVHVDGYSVCLNIDHIISVYEEDEKTVIAIEPCHPKFPNMIFIKESFEEVMSLINS